MVILFKGQLLDAKSEVYFLGPPMAEWSEADVAELRQAFELQFDILERVAKAPSAGRIVR